MLSALVNCDVTKSTEERLPFIGCGEMLSEFVGVYKDVMDVENCSLRLELFLSNEDYQNGKRDYTGVTIILDILVPGSKWKKQRSVLWKANRTVNDNGKIPFTKVDVIYHETP